MGNVVLSFTYVGTYVGLALATGRVAQAKGRSERAWLLYGGLVPIVSFIHAMLLDRHTKVQDGP
jgi:hypothetical protein